MGDNVKEVKVYILLNTSLLSYTEKNVTYSAIIALCLLPPPGTNMLQQQITNPRCCPKQQKTWQPTAHPQWTFRNSDIFSSFLTFCSLSRK